MRADEARELVGNRICKYPECGTILSRYNSGPFCAVHEDLIDAQTMGCRTIEEWRLEGQLQNIEIETLMAHWQDCPICQKKKLKELAEILTPR
ncbi:hypothetical protein M1N82_00350 [Dehalococcoidia bacterium]|nr:hypothetical protein [Dehalococcoidia bacterium]MCL0048145.1 hypothetical protein [Dehalococcoidia bacterium]MCL0084000.1 hypothetical protein [Dehalococcoidia bacterium]MCL0092082.1 hypothetical protein [Dehalococcoidia bacterium]MCL0102911.1 hypothetical protein [Dehalococcoidia bacterium]